jgi:alkylation response protein AidB-like acyl-CoA dehydrogenase
MNSQFLVVYAKTDINTDKPQHGITAFLVEKVGHDKEKSR